MAEKGLSPAWLDRLQGKILVTGAHGQDGAIASHWLSQVGLEVVVGVRRRGKAALGTQNGRPLRFVHLDMSSPPNVHRLVADERPDVILNFAGVSSVALAERDPSLSWRINTESVAQMLAAVSRYCPDATVVQASSSRIFEGSSDTLHDEECTRHPLSVYARSKQAAMDLVTQARDEAGLRASSLIFFNHESPLRGKEFVTKKIAHHVARLSTGTREALPLGSTSALRDWGWAPDYVSAALLAATSEVSRDWIVATGTLSSVSDFIALALESVGLGQLGHLFRETEEFRRQIDHGHAGDSRDIEAHLGWHRTMELQDIASAMVEHEIERLKTGHSLWRPDLPWIGRR